MVEYIPDRGDIVRLSSNPSGGNPRLALVISPRAYNERTGMALFCPLVPEARGYPFEVAVHGISGFSGVVLADHPRNIDWRARHADYVGPAQPQVVLEVLEKLGSLVEP